jgi:hypothetical protein
VESASCPYGSPDSGPTRVVVLKQGTCTNPWSFRETGLQRRGRGCERLSCADTYVGWLALSGELEGAEGLRCEAGRVHELRDRRVWWHLLFITVALTPSPCDLALLMVFTSALPTSAAAAVDDQTWARIPDGWGRGWVQRLRVTFVAESPSRSRGPTFCTGASLDTNAWLLDKP